jgi:hypothetical protein
MDTITKKYKIDSISKRFDHQYKDIVMSPKQKIISERLKNENPKTEQHIAEIIGNNTSTENKCNECGDDSDVLMCFENYGTSVSICPACLNTALNSCNLKENEITDKDIIPFACYIFKWGNPDPKGNIINKDDVDLDELKQLKSKGIIKYFEFDDIGIRFIDND